MTFQELGISQPILEAIEELGFANPMPIQEAVIPKLLNEDGDVVALAQTGTGKTAAYGIPVLQGIDVSVVVPQAVVMCPTRELCLQITEDLKDLSRHIDGLYVLPVYGGSSIESQIRSLKKGVHVIVATPGRLIDLMERKVADLSTVKQIILDEADEMLNMGFSESIDAVLEGVPSQHQTLLFSATMSKEIQKIANNYLNNAEEIVVGSRNEGAEHVNHEYYLVQAKDKYLALKRVVDFYPYVYAIIFCRTRIETQEVADALIRDGYNAEALHGDLSQAQRDLTMQKFRQHNTQLLVATDVAARGLDVDDLTHVINYGLPDDVENYTHRSGRTGRAGKKGTSISIIHVKEKGKVRIIEKVIGKQFKAKQLPDPKAICTKQLYKVIDQLERVEVAEEDIAPFLPEVMRKLDWLDKEDVVKRLVTMEFGRFLSYYANAPEIVQPDDRQPAGGTRSGKRGSGRQGAEPGYARFFIALGKRDNCYARDIISVINRYTNKPVDIGRIDLMTNFSFFEVPEDQAHIIERTMKHVNVKGRGVAVDRADTSDGAERPKRQGGKGGSRSPKINAKGQRGEGADGKTYAKSDWKKFFQTPDDSRPKRKKPAKGK